MGARRWVRGEEDVCEALFSSLDLPIALARVHPILRRLVGADASAVGVFPAALAGSPDWLVDGLPPAFFARYDEMATEDFVRDAVLARPSAVLRDHQMIGRRELERHSLYRRAREVGAPLEQVMAVMLTTGAEGASGLALYRDRRRPFSAHDQQTLQRLVPLFARAIHNCLLHARVRRKSAAFDALAEHGQLATVLVNTNRREAVCSAEANAIIETWFTPAEREGGVIPRSLMTSVPGPREAPPHSPRSWRRVGDRVLDVSYLSLSDRPGFDWLLILEVRHRPAWCASLTPTERKILRGLVDRWDNRLLASELRRSVETIKKHVSHILDKAGVEDRSAFANQQYDL
jgi:DNA-binding CsgD family transcriptional regulator